MAQEITFKDAKAAWAGLSWSERVALPQRTRHVFDIYFAAFDRQEAAPASSTCPGQEAAPASSTCAGFTPALWGGDQYRCTKCGAIWDRDEPKPICNME